MNGLTLVESQGRSDTTPLIAPHLPAISSGGLQLGDVCLTDTRRIAAILSPWGDDWKTNTVQVYNSSTIQIASDRRFRADTLSWATQRTAPRSKGIRTPWYLREGLDGMRKAVRRMRTAALQIDERVQFSSPDVQRVGDEDQESVFVVVTVYIPGDVDQAGFYDQLSGSLADVVKPEDMARLAVSVGRLGRDG